MPDNHGGDIYRGAIISGRGLKIGIPPYVQLTKEQKEVFRNFAQYAQDRGIKLKVFDGRFRVGTKVDKSQGQDIYMNILEKIIQ